MTFSKRLFMRFAFFALCIASSHIMRAQVVYEHLNNQSVYLFLDELEAEQAIIINSISKPYSRQFIYQKLAEAKNNSENLSKRQLEEIEFYMLSFGYGREEKDSALRSDKIFNGDGPFALNLNPIAATYKDKNVIAMLRPMVKTEFTSNNNQSFYHMAGGVGATLEVGNNFGAYFSLVDNSSNAQIVSPNFLQQKRGAPVRVYTDDYTFSEATGGAVYNWKWGNLGIVKDHVQWGPGYNGTNIISSSTNPAIPMIKFDIAPTKWLEFHYFHGWLNSGMFDTLYVDGKGTVREYAEPRYIAANLIEVKPWPHTNISAGNSLIYGSTGLNIAYLNPFLFYRPADYQASSFNDNAGTNGQMYFSISTRYIKHLHLYTSMFFDELAVAHIFDKELNHNQFSFKAGVNLTGLIKNTSFTAEFTRNNPWVYNHFQEITLFETNNYNLGHYLQENAKDIFLSARYSPVSRLALQAYYNLAQKGPEAKQGNYSGLPFLERITWQKQTIGIKASYQFLNNAYVYARYENIAISGDQEFIEKYTPAVYFGTTNNLTAGISLGF